MLSSWVPGRAGVHTEHLSPRLLVMCGLGSHSPRNRPRIAADTPLATAPIVMAGLFAVRRERDFEGHLQLSVPQASYIASLNPGATMAQPPRGALRRSLCAPLCTPLCTPPCTSCDRYGSTAGGGRSYDDVVGAKHAAREGGAARPLPPQPTARVRESAGEGYAANVREHVV